MTAELRRTYFRYLIAFVLTALSTMLGNILDGIIAGQLIGADAVAAIGTSRPLTQGFYTLHLLVGAGGGMLAGIAIGKKRRDEANVVFRTVVCTMAVIAVVATVVGATVPQAVTRFFCTDAALQPLAQPYVFWMMAGAFAYFGMYLMQTFVAVDGEPGLVTGAVVVDNTVNVVLSVVLIKYFNMGVAGAAVARWSVTPSPRCFCSRSTGERSPRPRTSTSRPLALSIPRLLNSSASQLFVASCRRELPSPLPRCR